MTVFDWALIVIFALAALWGFRNGLIDSLLTVIGTYVALLLSGQFASRIVNFFVDDIKSQALATAIGYVLIFLAVFIAARILGKMLKTGTKMLLLGWVDKLGGLAFGVVAGALLVGATVSVAARFVYDPVSKSPIPAQERQFRDRLHGWMVKGTISEMAIDAREVVPADVLGIMPSDFARSLDALKTDIQQRQDNQS
ncbi:MAG: CvpA family protein [Dehalococcoidia bacterium]|nr:CvpA family protein [Dehalococcoidia bacterium]